MLLTWFGRSGAPCLSPGVRELGWELAQPATRELLRWYSVRWSPCGEGGGEYWSSVHIWRNSDFPVKSQYSRDEAWNQHFFAFIYGFMCKKVSPAEQQKDKSLHFRFDCKDVFKLESLKCTNAPDSNLELVDSVDLREVHVIIKQGLCDNVQHALPLCGGDTQNTKTNWVRSKLEITKINH